MTTKLDSEDEQTWPDILPKKGTNETLSSYMHTTCSIANQPINPCPVA